MTIINHSVKGRKGHPRPRSAEIIPLHGVRGRGLQPLDFVKARLNKVFAAWPDQVMAALATLGMETLNDPSRSETDWRKLDAVFFQQPSPDAQSAPAPAASPVHPVLSLIDRCPGLKVLQLQPGAKEPVSGNSWLASMTANKATIETWIAAGNNVAVCPGDNYVFIDLDTKGKKNGLAAVCDLLGMIEPELLSSTYCTRTPSGGYHLLYRTERPYENRQNVRGMGFDVRGWHGYVVAAGSRLVAGQCKAKDTPGDYEVVSSAAPAPLPEKLATLLGEPYQRSEKAAIWETEPDQPTRILAARVWLQNRAPAYENMPGGGNHWTYATAAALRGAYALSEEMTVKLMDEPQTDGLAWSRGWQGDRKKFLETIHNAYSYAKNQPGSELPLRAKLNEAEGITVESPDIPANQPDDNTLEPFNRWRGYTIAQAQTDLPQSEMTVDQWFIARGYTALLAKRGTGKTVVMLDLALSLAHDRPWQCQATKTGLMAIYLCGEDIEGARDHAAAWCANQNGDTSNPRFLFVPDLPDLMNPDECKACAEHLKPQIPEGMRAVLFFDTWNRGAQRGKQKDDDAMNEATRNLERTLGGGISAKGILAAFHPPKSDTTTILGSTVIEGNSVGIWSMERDEATDIRTLTVTRLKAKGENSTLSVNWVSQEIPGQFDDFGKPATGAVAVHQSGEDTARLQDAARKAERAALAPIVAEVVNGHPERQPSMADIHKALAGQTYMVDGKPRQFPRGLTQAREKLADLFERNPFEIEPGKWLVLYQAEKNAKRFHVCNSGYLDYLRKATKPPKL